ncbi:MAG: actin-binding WH2 domain-containing protein [Drouetiella hepatica Uher 2000/2452]|jgi:hypothetical protein|uniref:Actin-binding WH2 domain-containing protein n=1 Tax=Drouetiella hepatica Uher 2000/2452 TaxID=904376 RepID=A0A951QAS2_9CYAN|nr:actin-binding WH2 domain-containing protein [Drouetiella hepatica Uher 2000/2452]
MKHFAVLIALLRDRPTFLDEIRRGIRVESKITSLLIASSTFFAIYGAIIGASSTWLQVIASAVKLPALYLITLSICLPALFFFDILFGSALSFSQYAALSLITVSVISVLLFSFAPITLFFLISVRDYNFFLLLNVGIFALTGFIGIRLFYEGMRSISRSKTFDLKLASNEIASEAVPPKILAPVNDFAPELLPISTSANYSLSESGASEFKPIAPKEDGLQRTRLRLLKFWLILYALVGSQLGWTLRPFFGAPGEPFQLFRTIEGNFYAQVWRSLLTLLGFN